jgi:hypothetical protein
MGFGPYTRAYPRVRVTKGYGGNETMTIKTSAPPNAAATIYSGQVISLDSSGTWVLGCPTGKTPYIAFQDGTDSDVVSSGLLLGLSCAGQYEFQTGYFVIADGSFAGNDLYLIASTVVPGSLTLASTLVTGPITAPLQVPNDIIGFTSGGGLIQVGPSINAAGAFIPGTNSEAGPVGGPVNVLRFTTSLSHHRSIAA